jgi:hypothetical protein
MNTPNYKYPMLSKFDVGIAKNVVLEMDGMDQSSDVSNESEESSSSEEEDSEESDEEESYNTQNKIIENSNGGLNESNIIVVDDGGVEDSIQIKIEPEENSHSQCNTTTVILQPVTFNSDIAILDNGIKVATPVKSYVNAGNTLSDQNSLTTSSLTDHSSLNSSNMTPMSGNCYLYIYQYM